MWIPTRTVRGVDTLQDCAPSEGRFGQLEMSDCVDLYGNSYPISFCLWPKLFIAFYGTLNKKVIPAPALLQASVLSR